MVEDYYKMDFLKVCYCWDCTWHKKTGIIIFKIGGSDFYIKLNLDKNKKEYWYFCPSTIKGKQVELYHFIDTLSPDLQTQFFFNINTLNRREL